jgi:hypothetical protein
MKSIQFSTSLVLLFSITLFASAYSMANAGRSGTHRTNPGSGTSSGANISGGPAGVHFKINGKQYDIPKVRGMYDKKAGIFTVYNAFLPGFPETMITLAVGANFTGSAGTFKSDVNDKGFVFGFSLGNLKDIIGYSGGKDDPDGAFTVASTPVSLTITNFSASGSDFIKGNVTAQGTFSGKVYDLKNKMTVTLTDGTFNVQPLN